MELDIAKEKQLELKKHISTIHCTNNLTLVQRKIFNALLYSAYSELPHKSIFTINTRELCKLIGYKSNDIKGIKKALLGLVETTIQWNITNNSTIEGAKWKACSILASVELRNGTCLYEYSHVMKSLLYHPEIYGRIDLKLVSRFKSSYGLALYENCVRYQNLPQTPWISLDIFRKLMGVVDNKYPVFRDFRRRVLNSSIVEVNQISSMNVSVEIEKRGHKIIKLRFKLNSQERLDKNTLDAVVQVDADLLSTLTDTFGLSEKANKEIFDEYDSSYIKEKVEMITKSDSFKSGSIKAIAGYLIQALRKDFKPSRSSRSIIDKQIEKNEKQQRKFAEAKEEKKRMDDDVTKNRIQVYLDSLSKEAYSNLMEEFEHNQDPVTKKWYKERGLTHKAVRGIFNQFILNQKL